VFAAPEREGTRVTVGWKRALGVVLVVVILLAADSAALHALFSQQGAFVIWDFQPIHVAAQAVLRGEDPYSPQVTRQIQLQAYGRYPLPGEDVHAFAYPLYVALLGIPFGLLPLAWAQSTWLALLQALAILGIAVTTSVWTWPSSGGGRLGMAAWSLIFYPLVWSFLLGQLAIPAFALFSLAAWAIIRHRDWLAGVTLGLSLIKPQISFLVVPSIFLWSLARRRPKLALSLALTVGVLLIVPLVILPSWPSEFSQRLGEYASYSPFLPPVALAVDGCCPGSAPWLYPLVVAALVVLAAAYWWGAARNAEARHFLWAFGGTLIISMLISPQVAIVNQVVLLIPLFGLLKALLTQGRYGPWIGCGLLALLGVGLWVLSWLPPVSTASLRFPVEHKVMSPILPWTLGLLWLVIPIGAGQAPSEGTQGAV
jgi:hypothetical protein